jgi:hypothetical protein
MHSPFAGGGVDDRPAMLTVSSGLGYRAERAVTIPYC